MTKINKKKGDKSKKKYLWAIGSIISILIFSAVFYFTVQVVSKYYQAGSLFSFKIKNENNQDYHCPESTDGDICKKQDNLVRRLIDGVYVEPGEENLYPVAIMIDNQIEARPAAGLSQANLVFEAEAEGGITRYLAIFTGLETEDRVGPVRSARPYYVDWAREFSALYAHSGGSPEALAKIIKEDIFDFNEFYNGSYFWRDKSRSGPHNIFTSTSILRKYIKSKEVGEAKFFSWKYKNDLPLEERPEESRLSIGYLLPSHKVRWEYDKEKNDYLRYLAGQIHRDEKGNEIRAKNIIVVKIKAEEMDEEFRLSMDYLGEGEAIICLDGSCREGAWKKKIPTSRLRIYNSNNEELEFNSGTAWVEVIRPHYQVSY